MGQRWEQMHKGIHSGIMLTLLLISMLTLTFDTQTVNAEPTVWTVDDDGPADFNTIQEAINAANDGDTIFVRSGTYYENIVVNKEILLTGERRDTTAIDGSGTGTVIEITTDYVTIEGLTIRNSGFELLDAGIRFFGFGYGTIIENMITNNRHGIFIYDSNSIVVSGNAITYNMYTVTLEQADDNCIESNIITNNDINGISLWNSNGNRIVKNTFSSSGSSGVYMHLSNSNVVDGNTITNNDAYGVVMSRSRQNSVNNNTITGNGSSGVFLANCSENIIATNIITNNSQGIKLQDSCNRNTIKGNVISDHVWDGIVLSDSWGNAISKNTIKNSRYGMVLTFSSDNNFIYHNNFINNTESPRIYESYGNTWDDGYPSGGNYWSDYTGADVKRGPNQDKPGSDGVGDTPYIIDEDNQDDYPLMSPWTPTPPKKEKNKVTIAAPQKGEIFFITPTPRMPSIICSAQVEGMDPDPTDISEFFWEAHLSYTWKHRGELRSQSFTFKEKTIGGSWISDFGSVLMGGNMEISVAVTIGGIPYRDSISIEIRGDNPDKETIKAELGELKYQILAYLESKPKWHHFDKKGLPIFGPPSGYGLMQLDPPPSYKEIWDWKASIKAGKEHFDKDIEAAGSYATYVKDYYGGKEPVTELSDTQILRQAYYSYNAGRAYWVDGEWWPYYIWDTETDTWIVNKKASSQGTKYADQAMEYLEDIPQGEPPKNW